MISVNEWIHLKSKPINQTILLIWYVWPNAKIANWIIMSGWKNGTITAVGWNAKIANWIMVGKNAKTAKWNMGGWKCKNCKMKHGWAKMQKLQNESSKYQAHGVFEKAQNFLSNFLSNFGKNAAFLCDLFWPGTKIPANFYRRLYWLGKLAIH